MHYCKCGNSVPGVRRLLNYDTCLECGEKEALRIKAYRAKCVAPAYNKGAYQYIHSKELAKDVGK